MPLVSKSFSDIITFTRASSGTYFDATGTLQTATTNAARFDYNPSTLAARGMLVEEQRTNSIRNNTMVGAVAGTPGTLPTNWGYFSATTGLTSSVVGTGTENGISYIDLKIAGTAGTASATEISIDYGTAATGQTWTASLYWKIAGGSATNITSFSLGQIEATNVGGFVAGAFIAQTTPTTNNLNTQRISYTRTLSGGGTVARVYERIQIIPVNGATIDITLRIGLPQLEQGAFATSVISTTTAEATRSADVASVNTLSPWYNASAGTLYTEAETYIPSSAANQFLWIAQLDDGSSSNKLQIILRVLAGYTDSSYDVRVSGVSQASFDTNTNDGSQKKALAIKANDFAFAVGGAVKNTDSSGSIPTVNRLSLGNQTLTSNFLNGYIRRITYYPRRLSNTELQGITT